MNRISVLLASLNSFIETTSPADLCGVISFDDISVLNASVPQQPIPSPVAEADDEEGAIGEKVDDITSPAQKTPLSLPHALPVLKISSSFISAEEKLDGALVPFDEDVAGEGLELMPSRRRIASPTQSLHFCWLLLAFVLVTDFRLIAAGRCIVQTRKLMEREE